MPENEQEANQDIETYNDIQEERAHQRLLEGFAVMGHAPKETVGICQAIEGFLK